MARSYHHGNLHAALLDAALAIVEDGGVAAVSMSKVAAMSGVSSGAPYRHFKDRAHLLAALSQRAVEACMRRLEAAAADAPDEYEAFRRKGIEYVRFAVDEPTLFALMSRGKLLMKGDHAATGVVAGSANDDDATRSGVQHVDHEELFIRTLAALLGSGERSAPLDPANPILQELAARCLVHGLAHYFVDGLLDSIGVGPEQAERLAEALTRTCKPVCAAGSARS
ncbi:MAG TPA: TetR/AcrR family transcriptional regulator [Sorangium sp.]|nr:TetR/AcrR family transcriptional regulator [Sorangium sp.]